MTNLSKLVREAADHAYWRIEVERVAVALDCADPDHVATAWQVISESIDTLQMIAFDYRHKAEEFLPVLRQWYLDQQTNWHLRNDSIRNQKKGAELAGRDGVLVHSIHSKLLGRIEAAYEHYEAQVQGVKAFDVAEPLALTEGEAQYALEIGNYIRKAILKLKHLQRCVKPSMYEFDVYRTILESAARHFESMAPSRVDEIDEAA